MFDAYLTKFSIIEGQHDLKSMLFLNNAASFYYAKSSRNITRILRDASMQTQTLVIYR